VARSVVESVGLVFGVAARALPFVLTLFFVPLPESPIGSVPVDRFRPGGMRVACHPSGLGFVGFAGGGRVHSAVSIAAVV
jgi:hypothetical protein